MRTTVEIRDEHRAKLLKLAAGRGEKGFSGIIDEALTRYLDEEASREQRVQTALKVLGTLDDRSADALEQSVHELRSRWR